MNSTGNYQYAAAGSSRIPNPSRQPNVPDVVVRKTTVPTVATPEAVLLEGIVACQNLGCYSVDYGMNHLSISVFGSTPRIGGYYEVGSLPLGEWFVIADRQGFALPVAVQKVRQDAYYVRVDPAPLQGLRALTSIPGY